MIGARRTDIADQILSSTKKEDGAALQLTPVKERKSGDYQSYWMELAKVTVKVFTSQARETAPPGSRLR